ncbi:MAG: hypothetical protein HGA45_27895 [Chloroflexales bacterium]|nr:hypothetical protein [Chloroflexales bacterium]
MIGTPAKVTVSRTLASDLGIRDVLIYLDGQMIATLKNKQSVTREVAPGHHTLRAHNTLVGKTIEFDVQPGEQIRFTTSNRSGCATSLIFILGAGPIYISFEREDDNPSA